LHKICVVKLKWLLSISLLARLAVAAPEVSIQLAQGVFRVTGSENLMEPAGGWASVFAVATEIDSAAPAPAMLGSYALEGGTLIFRPRFPLAEGIRYRAVYRPTDGAAVAKVFNGPARVARPATRVAQVYPSGDVLPANQLKLYIYFSAPMQRGGVWSHIHLLDDSGRPVNLAFLEIDQELWDARHQRLTVLFDPGRIKRGVAPEREIGPPIVSGNRYTLQIDRDILDAGGEPLRETWRKEFRGGPAVRSGIDLKDWQISAPAANSASTLVVDFPRPLDFALLEHAITVRGPDGPISGQVAVENDEGQWRFTPAQPWRPGDYELGVDGALEDLAGNRIGRPFDVDLSGPPPRRIAPSLAGGTATLRFHIQTR